MLKTIITVISIGLIILDNVTYGQIHGYQPGRDYSAFDEVPKGINFSCQGRLAGYYADVDTRCQVWHWCLHSGHVHSFICPAGTAFNQKYRVCDWFYNVDCGASPTFYSNNEELYRSIDNNII